MFFLLEDMVSNQYFLPQSRVNDSLNNGFERRVECENGWTTRRSDERVVVSGDAGNAALQQSAEKLGFCFL
jgi:hypothetical protein